MIGIEVYISKGDFCPNSSIYTHPFIKVLCDYLHNVDEMK